MVVSQTFMSILCSSMIRVQMQNKKQTPRVEMCLYFLDPLGET